jgi:phospholipid/cholesterol/gamma-HCH transport system permease protein
LRLRTLYLPANPFSFFFTGWGLALFVGCCSFEFVSSDSSPSRNYMGVALIGSVALSAIRSLGEIGGLALELLRGLLRKGLRLRLIMAQLVAIGYGSQAVVIVTGAFTGAVFAAQMFIMFKQYGLESGIGGIVGIALSRELGPTLAGLMVTGRVGGAMTAEIGTMKVTEQIDALRVMGVHPVDYLVLPRFIAMLISIPLLVVESLGFGMLACYGVTVGLFEVPSAFWMRHFQDHVNLEDVAFGMIKAVVFGVLIVLICCHQGLKVENGAVGVGRGTTQAVVYCSLAILIVNFFLTLLLSYFFPLGAGM